MIEESEINKGLVYMMHGLGCNKEEPSIVAIAESFKKNDYIVMRFDTRNTFGESEGKFENFTLTGSIQDLEDIISWSENQE